MKIGRSVVIISIFVLIFIKTDSISHAEYNKDSFVRSKVDTVMGGIHSTTRGTVRLVFVHNGKWLVFHGGPRVYQFSHDGVKWTEPIIADEATRTHLIKGDVIYSVFNIRGSSSRVQDFKRYAAKGVILDNIIKWGTHQQLDTQMHYYYDLKQDSTGRFTLTGRTLLNGKKNRLIEFISQLLNRSENSAEPMIIQCMRSKYPDNINEWELPVQCINHVSNTAGSVVHENISLDNGQSYVIGMIYVNGVGKLYGNLFDGSKWQDEDTELASGMYTVSGSDRRMSAEYDPSGKKIHLTYVDENSRLWYRTGSYPFDSQNWSDPLLLKDFPVFTAVLSLDLTSVPSKVWLVYGKTIFKHRDKRWESGELYLESFDGTSWSSPIMISEPGTKYNWYPNMIEDVSKNIGVMYLKGMTKDQGSVKSTLFDIMFVSTGKPK